MTRRGRRRLTVLAAVAVSVALVAADASAADPIVTWQAKRASSFAWDALRAGCGVAGGAPSVIRAETRWTMSPANGYTRLTFVRQEQDPATLAWRTVEQLRRSTKNTPFEGRQAAIRWAHWFFPFDAEAGSTNRHVVRVEWLRDRRGTDKLKLVRQRPFQPCVVAG
jgi:hypothetical protein